jgi:hypothetical protein
MPVDYSAYMQNKRDLVPNLIRSLAGAYGAYEKTQAANQMAERQAQMQFDFASVRDNPNSGPQDYANLMMKYPEQQQRIKGVYDMLGEDKRRAKQAESLQLFSLLEGGENEMALKSLNDRRLAAETSGNQKEAQQAQTMIDMINSNPSAAKNMAGMYLSMTMGPEKFAETYAKIKPGVEGKPMSAAMAEFDALIKDLPPEQQAKAKKIKLGLEARAITAAKQIIDIGGVPHEYNPTTGETSKLVLSEDGEVTRQTVAESEALIQGAKERGKRQAGISADMVKSSFESVGKIEQNLGNIDKAITALDKGARTGVINQWLPSFKDSTKELERLQNQFGLDVINSVTLGAISKPELDLVLKTGLDLTQSPKAVREQLVQRKNAQEKLANYLREQIAFLSGANADGTPRTVAQFLEMKKGPTGGDNKDILNQADKILGL